MGTADGQPLLVRLLGQVQAWRGEQELELGGPRPRSVLAMVAMRANQTVSRGELIDGIWGEDPPESAVNALHGYVAGLRRALEPDRARRAPGRVLLASASGYLLRLEAGQLDTQVFSQHLARASQHRAAGDVTEAARSLDAALGLWRAVPLSGIPGPWAEIERARMEEVRLAVVEERAEVMLAGGRHAEIAGQLAALVRQHPLRERFRLQQMLALYRCGRQAEALAVFTDTRRVLVEELGIEPGPQLRRLHQQVLAGDAGRHDRGPTQLPADVDAFTGRAGELADLDRFLAAAPASPDRNGQPGAAAATMVISLVSGTAGVGKTALAVHWAHRVKDAFPDGQLYVNLRGYDPDQPVPPADALAGFLRALGMAGQDIPPDLDERAAAYRSLLAGRRMLVVLDNAATAEQVRLLLPGSASSLVVVTSRDSVAGLVARHGARRLDLDILPAGDAVGLLRALIGDRVDAEPAASATLARQCARLPLALRVTAELAAARPGSSLAELAGELAGEQRRLDLLDAGGDARTGVRGVFSWSYQRLPDDAARAFWLLGLQPSQDLDPYATAALTGDTLEQGRDVLDALARAHLAHRTRNGRYGLHDLLRAYACELAAERHRGERRAALTRLFDYYLAAAGAAMDIIFPAERRRRPRVPPAVAPAPPLADAAAALAWLDAERATLVAVCAYAAGQGWPGHATRLAVTLYRYLETGGHICDAVAVHSHARRAARRTGDHAAEATASINLGIIASRQGRYPQAVGHHQRALALSREIADKPGEAIALANLGSADWRLGRYQHAAGRFLLALGLFRETGDQAEEAITLGNLGFTHQRQGRYRRATEYYQQALALCREISDRPGEARTLGNLGATYSRLGRHPQAISYLTQALGLFRTVGDRAGEAEALSDIAAAHLRLGQYPWAISYLTQALALFRAVGDRSGEAGALNGFGEVLLATDQPGAARAQHATALTLASRIGDQYEQARADDGLARIWQAGGDPGRARLHLHRALDGYAALDVPEAGDVRARLAALEPEPSMTT